MRMVRIKSKISYYIIIDDYPPRFESVINSFVIETVNLNLNEEEEITEWLNPQNFVGLNPDPEPNDLKDIDGRLMKCQSWLLFRSFW